jgi:hypothetical protein
MAATGEKPMAVDTETDERRACAAVPSGKQECAGGRSRSHGSCNSSNSEARPSSTVRLLLPPCASGPDLRRPARRDAHRAVS